MVRVADVALSSTRNPRVRAAAALRERHAARRGRPDAHRRRPRAGPGGGGRRPGRRGLRRSRPAGAGREAAVEAARAAGAEVVDVSSVVVDHLAYGDRGDGIVAVARIPDTSLEASVAARGPAAGRRRGGREAGQPRGRAPLGRWRRRRRRHRRRPRTDLFNPNACAPRRGRCSPFRWPAHRAGGARLAPPGRHPRAGGPRRRRRPLRRRGPAGSGRHRARQRGARALGRLAGEDVAAIGCRCSALPTASTSRSRPPCSSTRRGASEAARVTAGA